MRERKTLPVYWSQQALENAAAINQYLSERFDDKEVQRFFFLLRVFEEAVSLFPKLYPQTTHNIKIRRAILSKEVSAFYRIARNRIEVLALLDNRSNLGEWI